MRQGTLVTALALLATLAATAAAQGPQRRVVTPTTRTVPALRCDTGTEALADTMSTCPPSMAVTALLAESNTTVRTFFTSTPAVFSTSPAAM